MERIGSFSWATIVVWRRETKRMSVKGRKLGGAWWFVFVNETSHGTDV